MKDNTEKYDDDKESDEHDDNIIEKVKDAVERKGDDAMKESHNGKQTELNLITKH